MPPLESPLPRRRGVIAVVVREGRFLVIRRSRFVEKPRTYCFPGGTVESGESDQQTLQREMREELGVGARPLQQLWKNVTPWGVALTWWSAKLEDDHFVLCPEEVESVDWLTAEELRKLPDLLISNHYFLDAMDRGEFTIRQ